MSPLERILINALGASLFAAGANQPRNTTSAPPARPTHPAPRQLTAEEREGLGFPEEDLAMGHLATLTDMLGSPLAAARHLFAAPHKSTREAA